MDFAPPDTVEIGRQAAPIVLYHALFSSDGAADLRGGFRRIAGIAERFAGDEEMALLISEVTERRRHIWSSDPPTLEFVKEAAVTLSEECFPAMLVSDLAVIGRRLVTDNPKPRCSSPTWPVSAKLP